MSWVIRFFLFVFIFWVLRHVVRSFLARVSGPLSSGPHSRSRVRSSPAATTVTGKMIKDPQCGMYVAEDLAVQTQVEGTTIYFCSEECHIRYVSELKNRHQTDQQPV